MKLPTIPYFQNTQIRLSVLKFPKSAALQSIALVLVPVTLIFLGVAFAKALSPAISDITVGNVLPNSATVSWNTDVASDTQVEYGETTAYGSSTPLNPALTTSHSQTISGLQMNTQYNYKVKSRDGAGDLSQSGNRSFITALGSASNGTATDYSNSHHMHATKFTANAGGLVTSLSVRVANVAAAPNNKFEMAIYTDNGSGPGALVAKTATGTLTANSWNSLPLTAMLAPNTSYFIAYNTNGTSSTTNNMRYIGGAANQVRWRTYTFGAWPANFGSGTGESMMYSMYASFASADTTPPTVSITGPANNATVSGTVTVTADAADDSDVAGVQFKRGDANLGPEDTTPPYEATWDTSDLIDGQQTITAVARDTADNETTSAPVTVTTNNPSKLTITQPVANEIIHSTSVTVNYTKAGDLSNIDHAHFYLDGQLKMDGDFDGTLTYTNVPPGQHELVGYFATGDHQDVPSSAVTVHFSTTVPDTTPPAVSMTEPAAGATLSNSVMLRATATDAESSVAKVQFWLNDTTMLHEDTTAPYEYNWNTLTATNGPHTLKARAIDAFDNPADSANVSVTVANTDPRAVTGEWGAPINLPIVAVHASLLHTGEILMWDAWDPSSPPLLWNMSTNTFTPKPVPGLGGFELFCAGQATTGTGELVVAGGHAGSGAGIRHIFTFDPVTRQWARKADMQYPRWYPSVTQMADNRMIIFSGQATQGSWANTPEIFNPLNDTVSQLPFTTPQLREIEYPQTTMLPSGKILSISAEGGPMMVFDPADSSWTQVGTTQVLFGSWTSFAPGKYLITGGSDTPDPDGSYPSKKVARVLDMTSGTPVWSNAPDMAFARSFHNVTMLADGKALVTGGSDNTSAGSVESDSIKATEMWDPATNQWTQVVPQAKSRMYHSVSMLLPDGRVLSTGGGRLSPAPNQLNAEIYSPPYLFKGPRPTIASAPAAASHNSTLDLVSPQAADVAKVTLSSLGSVTHTADWNQHFTELDFTRSGDTLTINTPSSANIAPDGYYMLFIVDSNGVPSEAKIIKLSTPDTTSPQITNVAAGALQTTSATITWNTNEPATSQVVYGPAPDNYPNQTPADLTADTASHSLQLTGLTPGATYHYRVKSQDAWGNETVSPNFSFTAPVTSSFSLDFNGSNERVTVPHHSSLNIPDDLTVEAWIKPSSVSSSHRVVSKNYYELYVRPQGSGFKAVWRLRIGGSWRTVSPNVEFPLNQWHHVAGTYDGSIMRLFVNGQQVGTRNQTGSIASTSAALTIGARGSWYDFAGKIDEIRVSSTVRYNSSFTPSTLLTVDGDTRALWHLDEGSGTTAGDATGTNNGSLVNTPSWSNDAP